MSDNHNKETLFRRDRHIGVFLQEKIMSGVTVVCQRMPITSLLDLQLKLPKS